MRPNRLRWFFLVIILLPFAGRVAAERMEFPLYYPSTGAESEETGSDRLHVERMTVKDPEYNEVNVVNAGEPNPGGNPEIEDGELFVQKEVGIGTTAPAALLDVQGGIYLAGGTGDVTGDGTVNWPDRAQMINYLDAGMNGALWPPDRRARGDVNGDGWLTDLDLRLVTLGADQSAFGRSITDRTFQVTFDADSDSPTYLEPRVGLGTPTPRSMLETTGNIQLSDPLPADVLHTIGLYTGTNPFVSSRRIKAPGGGGDKVHFSIGLRPSAGDSNAVGINYSIGHNALAAHGQGQSQQGFGAQMNLAAGAEALAGTQALGGMVAVGYQAVGNPTSPLISWSMTSVGIGHQTGQFVRHDFNAQSYGVGAGALRSGQYGFAIGKDALREQDRGGGVAIGSEALYYSPGKSNVSLVNWAVGASAMGYVRGDAYSNLAIGSHAAVSQDPIYNWVSDGEDNVAVGSRALRLFNDGNKNIAIGYDALSGNHAGDEAIAIGADALSNQIHGENIAVGGLTNYLNQNAAASDAQNIAVGVNAGNSMNLGFDNLILGWKAGHNPAITGPVLFEKNILIGPSAGEGQIAAPNPLPGCVTTGGAASVLCKYLVIGNLEDFAQPLLIGRTAGTDPRLQINGRLGILLIPDAAFGLDVGGTANYTTRVTASDARLKTDLRPLAGVLDRLDRLRGVSFEWNDLYRALGRSTGRREVGFVAQEVEAVFPELVVRWGEEGYRGVEYDRFSALFVEAVKELEGRNQVLRERIRLLRERVAEEPAA
ncbi:MAG: hypothetical protein COV76_08115 [Candidatus Omnitrophica bacterium CG11_big_fil_rev_8_21_14_0_20_64_10]|nr:MAG: hypothetical protein COV76_08115 [Candidatus Omnitrophica bacterium CG11_big_fil_rev_8_21_14_0_20_64_10]